MPALATWTPEDGLLGALAPLGLAAAATRPVLVVDLDPGGPRYPGDVSLSDLVAEGPRLADLEPGRAGVALLWNGGVTAHHASRIVDALLKGWPTVVLRLPPRTGGPVPIVPRVPVRSLRGASLWPAEPGPAVWQADAGMVRLPPGGLRLPVPSRSTLNALLAGRLPPTGDRWIGAWRRVWGAQWER